MTWANAIERSIAAVLSKIGGFNVPLHSIYGLEMTSVPDLRRRYNTGAARRKSGRFGKVQ
jgi:hypothetical protein